MNYAKRGVAVAHGIGDDANSKQIVNLLHSSFLPLDFLMDGVKPLYTAFQICVDAILG